MDVDAMGSPKSQSQILPHGTQQITQQLELYTYAKTTTRTSRATGETEVLIRQTRVNRKLFDDKRARGDDDDGNDKKKSKF